jgi:membrane-bound lytic murein transglycosylase B
MHSLNKSLFKLFFLSLTFSFLSFSISSAQNLALGSDERASLEQELRQLEEESKRIQSELDNKKGERKGLEKELSLINSKISDSKNKIQKTTLTIKKIGGEIVDKEKKIVKLQGNIEQNREYIKNTIQDLRKLDDVRAVIALSSDQDFSELFRDIGDYKTIQNNLGVQLDSLKTNKKFVEVEKDVLKDKKDETEALKKKQELEKREEESRQQEKKTLITIKKTEEKDYEKVLEEKKKKVTQIKNRLFVLRDAGGITFDNAQRYAKEAGKSVGVRPALILAILKQESDLGKNEGRCYVTNFQNGDGVHSKTGAYMPRTMKPGRDIEPFLEITKSLGIDPAKRLVSCPLSYGYGGAMGPTQFIPSTWKQYQAQVARINNSLGDPWSGRDAITATALYLANSGATSQDYSSERNAACKYYSGKSCAKGVGAAGYGNSVMAHATRFQADIDLLGE